MFHSSWVVSETLHRELLTIALKSGAKLRLQELIKRCILNGRETVENNYQQFSHRFSYIGKSNAGMHPTDCLNCSAAWQPEMNYCPQCGQKTDIHRLTFTHILHEFFHAFTHADKGIFHLLNGLVAKPGTVEREMVEGKWKKVFQSLCLFPDTGPVVYCFQCLFHSCASKSGTRSAGT
jgi:hypothetical protein